PEPCASTNSATSARRTDSSLGGLQPFSAFRSSQPSMRRHALTAFVLAVGLVVLASGTRVAERAPLASGASTEVVVSLAAPPLARTGPAGAGRVDAEQHAFRTALRAALPDARVRWRYRLVLNGFSVVLPEASVPRLEALPGVHHVYASARYAPQATSGTLDEIGAPSIWGAGLATAGQGVKIGIIDSGINEQHPYFDPAGYTMPTGFPKGQV